MYVVIEAQTNKEGIGNVLTVAAKREEQAQSSLRESGEREFSLSLRAADGLRDLQEKQLHNLYFPKISNETSSGKFE